MSFGLTQSDKEMFSGFGVTDDLLERAGVHRVTDAEARRELGIHSDRVGDMAGIVFPYLSPANQQVWSQRLRRDNPEIDADGKPKDKYLCPQGHNRLYFAPGAGPLLTDLTTPVLIVEAEKSALALAAAALRCNKSWPVIEIGGCWGWMGKTGTEPGQGGERIPERGPKPDFGLLSFEMRRRIILVFDANTATNP